MNIGRYDYCVLIRYSSKFGKKMLKTLIGFTASCILFYAHFCLCLEEALCLSEVILISEINKENT